MPDGFAVVDKQAGWTSHDVVARARKVLGERRVGHAGTLDPDATGVLLLGVGRATRLLQFLTALAKTYTAEVVLGRETSTLDASGETTAMHDMHVDLAQVRAAAASLTGPIMQVPPMVSALKVDGRRLHELAREGIEVERAPRPVTVHRFDVDSTPDPLVYRVEVECSSGTYVRSLAADLGAALGGGAHLRALRRTKVGSFSEAEATLVDAVVLRPAAVALRDFASVSVDAGIAAAVAHGKVLSRAAIAAHGDGPWAVLDDAGALLAVYETTAKPDVVKPAVVLATLR
ncbi:MAG TPA: tRNA pseudouridine(55) synthase TruB [Acidimicrobiales bacterium]|nr:tRNA pseudouridine(55) synthase TruB [Acidimicrobiales bacterium]